MVSLIKLDKSREDPKSSAAGERKELMLKSKPLLSIFGQFGFFLWPLSTQALQNRSQKYSSVSQSGATAFPWRDPAPGASCPGPWQGG